MSLAVHLQNREESGEKEGSMNRENSDLLKVYIFYCSNSSRSDEFDALSHSGEDEDTEYKIISLPCSGKANLIYFLKAFETGANGLVIITCSKKACRYLEGNLRAPRRAEEIDSLLEEVGMGRGRIAVLQRNADDNGNASDSLIAQVEAFRDKIRVMSSSAPFPEVQPAPSTFQSLPTSGGLQP